MNLMKCLFCNKETTNKRYCSHKCYWNSLKGVKGENAPNYRKIVGKSQIHKWLDVNYGNIKICEGANCNGKSIWYDWALKKGKKYERNRDNFLRLCRSCHRKYDFNEEKKTQAVKNLFRFNPYYGTERKKVA